MKSINIGWFRRGKPGPEFGSAEWERRGGENPEVGKKMTEINEVEKIRDGNWKISLVGHSYLSFGLLYSLV